VSAEGPASLKVYESSGRLVRTLAQGRTRPGACTPVWDATDNQGRRVAAGVDFYSLGTGCDLLRRKVVLAEQQNGGRAGLGPALPGPSPGG